MNTDTSILSMDHIQFDIQTVDDDANPTTPGASGGEESIATDDATTNVVQQHSSTVVDAHEEAQLDPLVLEVQDWNTLEYRILTAQHHPDYLGGGTGEYFFPLETGAWEQ